mmetsp:Transcript_68521/g.76641  ORF Transcript_68521/g.76641 Transcript_68521/m.76641 type:complete len:99 (-) Transcript_68521:636-932(-)
MGVSDGSKFLRRRNPSPVTLDSIRKDIISEFPTKGPHPYVGIDVSIDINISIKQKVACQQHHMQTDVPVVAVAGYVRSLCLFLKRKDIHPILVFKDTR